MNTTCPKKYQARFEVPFNWSASFLDFIINRKDHISAVYGSLIGDPSGRPIPHSIQLAAEHHPNEQHLIKLLEKLNAAGIPFNLVMNSSCYGNRLLSDDGKEWLKLQVARLSALGIGSITVSNFDLARRVSALAPNIKIILSVMFNVVNVDAIGYALKQDFNLSGMLIGKGAIKDITRLKQILELLERKSLKGTIIANDLCPTGNCPERMSDHNNSCAHYYENTQDYVSPSLHCRLMAMKWPAHFFQASVVSPNDISFYEGIGVQHFKLTDRVMPDETLIKVCNAYFDRAYSGNLFDLFTFTSYLGETPKKPRRLTDEQISAIYLGGYAAFKANRTYFVCQPFANAVDISGTGKFFEFFEQGRCTMQCGSRELAIPGCYYCEDSALKYLRYDRNEWEAVRSNIDRYIQLSRLPKVHV